MLAGCVEWPSEFATRYRRDGYWTGERLGDLLRGVDPARVAVVHGTRRLTYGALDAEASRLAGGFARLGVRPGDRVVVQLPNIPEFVTVSVALFRLGAVPVYALPAHRRAEIEYLCEHTEAVAYVVPDVHAGFDFRSLARSLRPLSVVVVGEPAEFVALADLAGPFEDSAPGPGEVAFMLLSGGTTGLPKLIPRTHDDYAYQLRATAAELGFDTTGVYLAALPAAHNAALGCPGVLGTLRTGGRVVLASSPSPDEVFPLIAREGVTLTTLMPAFLPLWAELAPVFGVDLRGLVVEVGGARLDPEVAEAVRDKLGCRLTRWFGMAEGLLSFTRLDEPPDVLVKTEGRPLCAADELRVVDTALRDVPPGEVGELLVRGPYTLRGYYRAPDYNATTFTPDGFLRTGDLVRFTADGHLVVEGRIKDVVNRGGEKVSPGEVEAHLSAHPSVAEAAVIAIPDPSLGEKTCAVVVPTGQAPTLAGLRDFLAARGLAGYKLPDQLRVVTELPRTSLGKVNKAALRNAA